MNGFEGMSRLGIIKLSICCSYSGTHNPIDNERTSTPTLFLASFYLIFVTSSNWINLYLDLLWLRMTSDSPLFREEYWHREGLDSRYSSSFKLRSLLNLFFRLFSRSFRMDFSYSTFYWLLILGSLPSVILKTAILGSVLRFYVKPNLSSSAVESISYLGGYSKLKLCLLLKTPFSSLFCHSFSFFPLILPHSYKYCSDWASSFCLILWVWYIFRYLSYILLSGSSSTPL